MFLDLGMVPSDTICTGAGCSDSLSISESVTEISGSETDGCAASAITLRKASEIIFVFSF